MTAYEARLIADAIEDSSQIKIEKQYEFDKALELISKAAKEKKYYVIVPRKYDSTEQRLVELGYSVDSNEDIPRAPGGLKHIRITFLNAKKTFLYRQIRYRMDGSS